MVFWSISASLELSCIILLLILNYKNVLIIMGCILCLSIEGKHARHVLNSAIWVYKLMITWVRWSYQAIINIIIALLFLEKL